MIRQTRSLLAACVLALVGCGEPAPETTPSMSPQTTEEPAPPSAEPAHDHDLDAGELAQADSGEAPHAAGDAALADSALDASQDAAPERDAATMDASIGVAHEADAGATDAACTACVDAGTSARDADSPDASPMDANLAEAGLDAARMDGATDGSARQDGASTDDGGADARPPTDTGADAATSSDAAQPALGTFTRVYQLMRQRCRGCHVPGAAYSLDLSQKQLAYDELVGGPNMGAAEFITCSGYGYRRVVPGAPSESLLWQKLRDLQPCGDQMPPGSSVDLTLANEVEAWISAGAWND